ncbi:MAG: FKBP-type peptidyl-prolyl cis-trans isomerase [Bacteroidota bacterium]
MKSIIQASVFCMALTLVTSCEGQSQSASEQGGKPVMKTKLDSLSYAIGGDIGRNLKMSELDKISIELMAAGMRDVFSGKESTMSQQQCQSVINEYIQSLQQKKQEESGKKLKENKDKGAAFLSDNGKKSGVKTLPSGLQYSVIKEGKGPKPKETDMVKTHYHGTLINGTVFDSSVDRKDPATFPVNGVIKGWVEALQLMPVGSKWKLFIPSDLAYGDAGSPPTIGPGETLVFEVELLSIETQK